MVKEYIPKKLDKHLFRINPDYDYITFGNEVFGGRLLSRTLKRNYDGMSETFIVFIPSDELKVLYSIENDELGSNGEIGVWYPSHFIYTAEFDPLVGRRTKILCTFDKEETLLMNLIKGRLNNEELLRRELSATKIKLIEKTQREKKSDKDREREFFERGTQYKELYETKKKREEDQVPVGFQ